MSFEASAPGSLMLLGEYGVLQNEIALTCALDKRINVSLTPRPDREIHLVSDPLGHYTTSLSQLTVTPPFEFILATLQHYQAQLSSGCHLTIQAAYSDKMGLGSSAAVTVATVMAVMAWLNLTGSARQVLQIARTIVRRVQGIASGADLAAAVYGGIVAYQAEPLRVKRYAMTCPLTVLYSGTKVSTREVIAGVHKTFAHRSADLQVICRQIGQCARDGLQAIQQADWPLLGKIMTRQQALLVTLGVSTPLLTAMQAALQTKPTILGAKISGAGLGDCVIGLGSMPSGMQQPDWQLSGCATTPEWQGVKVLPVAMSLLGACLHNDPLQHNRMTIASSVMSNI